LLRLIFRSQEGPGFERNERREDKRDDKQDGEDYDGPPGMAPEGVIDVSIFDN
jgi:hypothetical protein